MKKIIQLFLAWTLCLPALVLSADAITPYKYSDKERNNCSLIYEIPPSSRFTTKRNNGDSPDIIYYFSKPSQSTFPIAILVGGSSSENDIISIIHFHRYFLKEFLDLGVGVLTIEQEGVDGNQISKDAFMENYTISNRLSDHRTVIQYLKKHPPLGWNGKFILLGVSEGGPIATRLTTEYPSDLIATINWCGAGDGSWSDHLWFFIQDMQKGIPWYIKLRSQLPSWIPYSLCSLDFYFPKSRKEHDRVMAETIKNPTAKLKIAGMTYKYHADALNNLQRPEYDKIKTPFLVVAGTKDSIIDSADTFVLKAHSAGAPITYMRISGMDHYVRKNEAVIKDSFEWLNQELLNS